MRKGGVRRHNVLNTVADAAVILAPSHLTGIGVEVRAADAAMNAHLSTAEARGERYSAPEFLRCI